jgi:hypothetical protein
MTSYLGGHMPRVKIKMLNNAVATSGLHFGGSEARRKLEPGEVVEIPDGELFEQLMATGKLELTREPVNRPLDFVDSNEARLTSPSYKPKGDTENDEKVAAIKLVKERLDKTKDVSSEGEEEKTVNPRLQRRAS